MNKLHFKACPIEAKKWANQENKKLILCNYCEQPIIDYKALYEKELENVDYYKQELRDLYLKDSCHKILIRKENLPWKIIELEKPIDNPFYTEICKMITLTFDPRKFPVLFDKRAQRQYVAETINEFITTFPRIDALYGCYELHENGVVHSHFIIPNISNFELKFLRLKYTDNDQNIHAVHCCEKVLSDGVNYVNKKETKDIENLKNYYIIKKYLDYSICPVPGPLAHLESQKSQVAPDLEFK